MSPRNWRSCPQCTFRHENEIKRASERALKAYGKVSAEKYTSLVSAVEDLKNEEPGQELAEYYEMSFADAGKLKVRYSVHCHKCGFEHEHRSESAVAMTDKSE